MCATGLCVFGWTPPETGCLTAGYVHICVMPLQLLSAPGSTVPTQLGTPAVVPAWLRGCVPQSMQPCTELRHGGVLAVVWLRALRGLGVVPHLPQTLCQGAPCPSRRSFPMAAWAAYRPVGSVLKSPWGSSCVCVCVGGVEGSCLPWAHCCLLYNSAGWGRRACSGGAKHGRRRNPF